MATLFIIKKNLDIYIETQIESYNIKLHIQDLDSFFKKEVIPVVECIIYIVHCCLLQR
jgi:hypothetical protein